MFLEGVDQSTVDNTTEYFLDEIENTTDYNKWYCGHYHTDKDIDKIKFMFNKIEEFKQQTLTLNYNKVNVFSEKELVILNFLYQNKKQ